MESSASEEMKNLQYGMANLGKGRASKDLTECMEMVMIRLRHSYGLSSVELRMFWIPAGVVCR